MRAHERVGWLLALWCWAMVGMVAAVKAWVPR